MRYFLLLGNPAGGAVASFFSLQSEDPLRSGSWWRMVIGFHAMSTLMLRGMFRQAYVMMMMMLLKLQSRYLRAGYGRKYLFTRT